MEFGIRTHAHGSFRTPCIFVVFHLRTPLRTPCPFFHVRRSYKRGETKADFPNGSRHNVNREHCFIKIQNLAPAALDALNEDDESLERIAHLHCI
ncbi:unnamed protein product [Rotaria socialis]|uniref:Uncharacterized protein n=1 Tax=Rotaria socialis TaxID=392032 RepID=A0A817TUY2_9BILA|nr:unnamed protein product [Rotaria socialis]